MKITLESTSTVVTMRTPEGFMPVRLFEGTLESGIPVHAYVARVYSNSLDDAPRLEAEQANHREPSPAILAILADRGDD